MPYISQYDLAQDLAFRKMVYVAQAVAAVAIAGEAKGSFSDVKYGKRQALATDVLRNPTGWIDRFCLAVVQNVAIVVGPAVNIVSSTNAYPIVVTATAHGLVTGDTVRIEGHLVNTSAVGSWPVTMLTANTFSIPVAGVGIGGATGRIQKMPIDSDVQFTVNAVWDDIAGVTALD